MAIRHHPSLEIREFLTLYLLERAAAAPFAPADLGPEVERVSERDLLPAADDVRAVQIASWERGWTEADRWFGQRPVRTTPAGDAELARLRAGVRGKASGSDRERAAERLIALVRPERDEEVLDIGTGEGFLACKLAASGCRVLGVDTDAGAIREAEERCETLGSQVRFQAADVRDLATQGAEFPWVVMSYVLHECEEPLSVLEAACSCVAPGGLLACLDLACNCAAYVERAGRSPFHPFRALAEGDWHRLAPQLKLSGLDWQIHGHVSLMTARKAGGRDGPPSN